MIPSGLTWEIARAGGFMAYGLLTASTAIGLILSLKWRSPRWTRFITTELHRFVTLVALVFIALHTLMVAIDPFIRFTPAEVLVPFVSHYRPVWIALGITCSYLLVAVYLSDRIRLRVGYQWWRRFHYLSFAVFALALIHGLGTGSDTRTPWAIGMYAGSVVLVAALIAARIFPIERARWHPALAVVGAGVLVAAGFWALRGPLQPGWNTIANDGRGSGGSGGSAAASTPQATASAGSAAGQPFADTLTGQMTQQSDGSVVLTATLGSTHDQLTVRFRSADGGRLVLDGAALMLVAPNGDSCSGPISGVRQSQILATCQGISSGATWHMQMSLADDANGLVQGTISATPG